jgi:glycosyltransferase involved in cell wall biosynthesis
MLNPVLNILRSALNNRDPLNILTFVSHERFEPNLCKTGHNFYSLITEGTRYWHTEYAPVPDNYIIFRDQIPSFILDKIDLIISHNPFVHIPIAYKLGLKVPLINIFHTMPPPGWDSQNIPANYKQVLDFCTDHVYISEFNRLSWGYNTGHIIHHGIDDELFTPGYSSRPRENKVLSVANDYINRDWCLGFSIWKAIAQDLPMFLIGDTPGLSKPAPDLPTMIKHYQESLVFLNTSTASPIPMSLLEAMACGCACVSAATCMIPDIIDNGKDGFLCPPHKPEMFKERCQYLLDNPTNALEMGNNARKKIQDMFGLDRFVQEWKGLIDRTL